MNSMHHLRTNGPNFFFMGREMHYALHHKVNCPICNRLAPRKKGFFGRILRRISLKIRAFIYKLS